MKTTLPVLALALVLASVAFTGPLPSASAAGDEFSDFTAGPMPAIVQGEYAKMQQQLQAELSASQARIKDLQAQQDAARSRAIEASKSDNTGLKLMDDFDSLLRAKYVDKKGKFQPGFELTKADVDNLNGIFQEHLSMLPFSGRVSAGQARRQLDWAEDFLEDILKAHKSPSEKNNSELEILGKQIRDENAKADQANRLADRLGIRLNPNLPAPARAKLSANDPGMPRPPKDGLTHVSRASKKPHKKKHYEPSEDD